MEISFDIDFSNEREMPWNEASNLYMSQPFNLNLSEILLHQQQNSSNQQRLLLQKQTPSILNKDTQNLQTKTLNASSFIFSSRKLKALQQKYQVDEDVFNLHQEDFGSLIQMEDQALVNEDQQMRKQTFATMEADMHSQKPLEKSKISTKSSRNIPKSDIKTQIQILDAFWKCDEFQEKILDGFKPEYLYKEEDKLMNKFEKRIRYKPYREYLGESLIK